MSEQRYPMPLPFGWFHAAFSHELQPGDSKPLRYFGKEMVLFRTESGKARILDAYCPHLGAHLGYGIHENIDRGGAVQGETIVCPFHGWRFNGDGFCEEVPYAKNIPPKLRDSKAIEPWHVCEVNQVIWVWYHPEGAAPMWEVEAIPEADPANDEWGPLDVRPFTIKTHLQEMAENGVDIAHFRYVHQTATFPDAEVNFEGNRRSSIARAKLATPRGEVDGSIASWSVGPGQGWVRFSGICETLLLGNITPVDEDTCQVNFAFIQKKVNGEVPKGGVNAAIIADICKQLDEDTPIWENKIYQPNPTLCDGDGPIAKFRKWYSQFYA